jgi:ABC-type glycerol-3-phosphate transport system substrate-binding protein
MTFNHSLRLLLAYTLLLAACTGPAPTPEPSPLPPPPTATPPPVAPGDTPEPTATFIRPGDPVTLTVWTTADLAPNAQTPDGALLTVQIGAFEESHSGAQVNVVLKQPYGPGGLLDFLSSASAAAPAVTPDLIALDAAELPAAVRAGLIVPLDDQLDPQLIEDFYPFARSLVTVAGHLYGVPFAADAYHLAYNRNLNATAPLSWTEVISGSGRLGFAGGSPEEIDTVLADYLAAGGTLVDANGRPRLVAGPLTEVLTYYRAAQDNGRLSEAVASTATTREAWDLYRAGKTTQTMVNARLYMAERETLRATDVATPPGPERPAAGLASAWAWAIPVRADPERQRLAVELLKWLVTPENMGQWTLAANRLPTRRAAWPFWPPQDPYAAFLSIYLETVQPAPPSEIGAKLRPALYRAVQAVLANGVPPEIAAAAAVAEVGP